MELAHNFGLIETTYLQLDLEDRRKQGGCSKRQFLGESADGLC